MHFRSLTWPLKLLILPIAFFVGIIVFLLALPDFASIEPFPDREFEDIPGSAGIVRIRSIWPSSISADDIVSLSYARFSTRDSSTMFLKIKTDQGTAEKWIESGQRRLAALSDSLRANGQLEEVATWETEMGFPDEVYANGKPDWWDPADILSVLGTKVLVLKRSQSNEEFVRWESASWAFDANTNLLWHVESSVR